MILKALRQGLGHLIIFIDFLTRPRQLKRSPDAQARVNEQAKTLSLYQFYACPFCVKVRRTIRRLNLPIETRNALQAGQHREDLEQLGGQFKVPCLRIDDGKDTQWIYHSDAIIAYLEGRFENDALNATLNVQNT